MNGYKRDFRGLRSRNGCCDTVERYRVDDDAVHTLRDGLLNLGNLLCGVVVRDVDLAVYVLGLGRFFDRFPQADLILVVLVRAEIRDVERFCCAAA